MFYEPGLTSNLWFSFAVFGGLIVVFHVAFVAILPLSAVAWKRVDYIWLAFASLSLIAAVSQDRRIEARNAYEQSLPSLEFNRDNIIYSAKSDRHYYCELTFHKGPASPPTFDEFIAQQHLACAWYKKVVSVLETEARKPSPDFRPSLISRDPRITDSGIGRDINDLFPLLEEEAMLTKQRDAWRAMGQDTEFDWAIIRLSPLLLAFALALRITKVTGELRLARSPKPDGG